jgi:hypothetical protein
MGTAANNRKQETTMLTKKLALLAGTALTLTTATAAFAHDYGYRDGYRHYRGYHERVVVRPYYAPAYSYYTPAPVYYAPAPAYSYYEPAPVYYGPGAGTVGGAVVGAIIGNQVASRHNRAVGTAAGAVIGAAIGSSIDRGY